MPVTNFTSVISTQAAGTADVQKLAESFDRLSLSIADVTKKADKVNEHPGFAAFAEKVKQGIQDPLGAMGDAAEKALKSLGPVGTGVAAAGAAFAAAGVAAFSFAKQLGEYGTQIENLALRTGLTTKEVQQFSFAARVSGQDVTVFETAMRKLSQGLTDTSEEGEKARRGLSVLGVSAYDATGKMRPMSDIFLQISRGLNTIEDPARRNTEALRVFGRVGIGLLPAIRSLSTNLELAKQIGLGVSDADIQKWEAYRKQIVSVEAQWDQLVMRMKQPLAATVTVLLQGAQGDNSDLSASAVQALKSQIGKTSPDELMRRLQFGAQMGIIGGTTYSDLAFQIQHTGNEKE